MPELGNIPLNTPITLVAVSEARNLLLYEDASNGVVLDMNKSVYRSSFAADGTFPTITDTGIANGSAYYQFELEMSVPATVPSAFTGPTGWTWVDGHGLPDPADLVGGETVYISVRLDCASGVRSYLASVWRVA